MPRILRYFQFSLRTLLIVVALIGCAAGWLGIEMRKVRARAKVLQWFDEHYPHTYPGSRIEAYVANENEHNRWQRILDDAQLPWHRRLLGDHYLKETIHPVGASREDLDA